MRSWSKKLMNTKILAISQQIRVSMVTSYVQNKKNLNGMETFLKVIQSQHYTKQQTNWFTYEWTP